LGVAGGSGASCDAAGAAHTAANVSTAIDRVKRNMVV
jgi:hypothetical protein